MCDDTSLPNRVPTGEVGFGLTIPGFTKSQGRSWNGIHMYISRTLTLCSNVFISTTPRNNGLDVDLSRVPIVYHDLREDFSKYRATSLPLQRSYDCGIDLYTGTLLPIRRLYPLSVPETITMEAYIKELLLD